MFRRAFLIALFLTGCPRGGETASPTDQGTGTANAEAGAEGSIAILFNDPSQRQAPSEKCDVELCTSLLGLIERADHSIDFAIYGMRGTPAILAALQLAKERGVVVRGIVDRDLEGNNYYANTDDLAAALGGLRSDREADLEIKKLEEKKKKKWGDRTPPCERPAGFVGPLQCLVYELGTQCLVAAHASREPMNDGEAIMHNKFFVVDERFVWTGSANASDSGVGGYNANLVTVVDSAKVAGWYTAEFEQMYEGGRYHTLKKSTGVRRTKVGDADVEVLFSPQDRPITKAVRPLLQAAEKRIDIAVFFLTNKHITADLIEAKARGVKVRIILDATAAKNGYTKHTLLRAAGIPVKVENWGGKMHMKSAAIDGKHVITGSMNWTSAGEYSNDENTVIIHGEDHARAYHRFFDDLWYGLPDTLLEGRPDPESRESGTACSDGSDNDFDKLRDGEDPGCGEEPPPLPPLPPYAIVPKGEHGNCPYWRHDLQ